LQTEINKQMKSYLVILSIFILAVACESNPKNPKEPLPNAALTEQLKQESVGDSANWTSIQWLDSAQKFGKVVEGEKVMVTFHFKNTGNKPLIIASVQASCGCTVPSKPEEPIAPGGEGVIKAEFNSEGRVGMANKTITVRCNTEAKEYVLKFEGEVLAKK
jgi:Protein of unknown function (DUF1573)